VIKTSAQRLSKTGRFSV